MVMELGNIGSNAVPSVMDLSRIGSIKRQSIVVMGLLDGTRIVAELKSDDGVSAIVANPLRLIIQPIGGDKISVQMIDFAVGADEAASSRIAIRATAIIFTYTPDESIADGYCEHVYRKSQPAKTQ